MRQKYWAIGGCTLALAFAATSWAVEQGDKDKDKDKVDIEGSWKVTKLIYNGKDVSEFIKDKTIVFTFGKDNKFSSKEGEKVEEGKYKIDTTKKPMQIDLPKGAGGKDDTPGIFAVDGDTLTLGLGTNKDTANKRPASFEDAGHCRVTLKKQPK